MAPDNKIIRILKKDSPATVRHICSLLHPSLSWDQAQPNPAAQIRQRCTRLIEKGALWYLGKDIYSNSDDSATIDERIFAILSSGQLDLNGLVLAIWPTLDERPREVALTAIHYVRFRVNALISEGKLKNENGKLMPG